MSTKTSSCLYLCSVRYMKIPFCSDPLRFNVLPSFSSSIVCKILALSSFMMLCGFPGSASGKEHACQCRRHKKHGFDPWVRKIPWRRAWQPTAVFLPGESHGQRSLVRYSPQGCKELNTTEVIYHACMHCKCPCSLSKIISVNVRNIRIIEQNW